MKNLWEYSIEELDKAIAKTEAILETSGYIKHIVDHLNLLQEHRDERLLEENIISGSKLGRKWRDNDDTIA